MNAQQIAGLMARHGITVDVLREAMRPRTIASKGGVTDDLGVMVQHDSASGHIIIHTYMGQDAILTIQKANEFFNECIQALTRVGETA